MSPTIIKSSSLASLVQPKKIGILGVVLLLAGCMANMPASREQMTNAGLLPLEQISKEYQVDTNWWQAYQDPSLNNLVQQTLESNIDLKQTAISLRKAIYSYGEARRQLLPTMNSSLGASVNREFRSPENEIKNFNATLGLSYELDIWQKLQASKDAADWAAQASAQDLAAVRLSLLNNVIDNYFNLAYTNAAIELTQQSINQYQQIERIARAQYQAGKVSSIDVTNADQSRLEAENSLLSLRQDKEQLETAMRELSNQQASTMPTITVTALQKINSIPVDLEVPLSVLSARPDLRAAEYRLQQAYASQQSVARSWYPSVSIGGAINSSAQQASSMFSFPAGMLKVNIILPFLDWPTLYWQNKQAEADFEHARLDFEKALNTALNEVDSYYRQYQLLHKAWQVSEQKYRSDQESSRYYRVRYESGANPLKDWLDALTKQDRSARNLIAARYAVLRQENLIYMAMAGRYRNI